MNKFEIRRQRNREMGVRTALDSVSGLLLGGVFVALLGNYLFDAPLEGLVVGAPIGAVGGAYWGGSKAQDRLEENYL